MKRIWLVWVGHAPHEREWLLEWFPTRHEAEKHLREQRSLHLIDVGMGVARFDAPATPTKGPAK